MPALPVGLRKPTCPSSSICELPVPPVLPEGGADWTLMCRWERPSVSFLGRTSSSEIKSLTKTKQVFEGKPFSGSAVRDSKRISRNKEMWKEEINRYALYFRGVTLLLIPEHAATFYFEKTRGFPSSHTNTSCLLSPFDLKGLNLAVAARKIRHSTSKCLPVSEKAWWPLRLTFG